MEHHLPRVSGASDLAQASRYALRHWSGLIVFLEDGRVEMDNNVVERAIRPIPMTRKVALFAGSDGGARHWAIAMTLIQTGECREFCVEDHTVTLMAGGLYGNPEGID